MNVTNMLTDVNIEQGQGHIEHCFISMIKGLKCVMLGTYFIIIYTVSNEVCFMTVFSQLIAIRCISGVLVLFC